MVLVELFAPGGSHGQATQWKLFGSPLAAVFLPAHEGRSDTLFLVRIFAPNDGDFARYRWLYFIEQDAHAVWQGVDGGEILSGELGGASGGSGLICGSLWHGGGFGRFVGGSARSSLWVAFGGAAVCAVLGACIPLFIKGFGKSVFTTIRKHNIKYLFKNNVL